MCAKSQHDPEGHGLSTVGNWERVRDLAVARGRGLRSLIVDAKLPEIDGPTLYREVLARWPAGGLRVLFVSGFAESPDCEDALNAQDVSVLLKPFTIDELGAVLDRVLATV